MQPQNNTPYNQPPMPPFAPVPPQPAAPRPRGWRERWMHRFGMDTVAQVPTKGAMTIPNWITGRSMVFFFIAMFACWAVFGYVPAIELWLVSSISVILFFYGGATMSRSWAHANERRFIRNVFIAGFTVRMLGFGI